MGVNPPAAGKAQGTRHTAQERCQFSSVEVSLNSIITSNYLLIRAFRAIRV